MWCGVDLKLDEAEIGESMETDRHAAVTEEGDTGTRGSTCWQTPITPMLQI